VKGLNIKVRPAASTSGRAGARLIVRTLLAGSAPLAALTILAALASCASGPAAARQGHAAPSAPSGTAVSVRSPGTTGPPAPASAPPPPPARNAEPRLVALPVAPLAAASEPQTGKVPDTSSTAFKNAVHDIWLAVTTGNAGYAKPAFFPEKAYAQVKAIGDPDSDWQYRLWYDFTLDLAAVHRLVPGSAALDTVLVDSRDAVWVPAGACYNSAGYWHVSDSRVVYREDGATHSFGIASFISWRGDWYLIHFGAVVRSGDYGIVDDPRSGPGVAGPTANC
jgi:hypothetical protein